MANEFKVKKGLIVQGSGSTGDNTILDVQGNQGQLFSITDSLEGTLFSVSDISGIPILDVNSNEIVKIGTFGSEGIIVNGSNVTASANISASGDIQAARFIGDGTNLTGVNNYVLPTNLAGDDINVDTGALTGAVVVSDIDINITTNTSGLVTDANGAVSTRTLTLANLGYTGATDATNNTGTVTGVTTGNSNTITIGGTSAAPTVAANTAAVSDGGSNLATGDQIYDHVTTRISGLTSNSGTVDTTGTINNDEFPQFSDSNTLKALTVGEMKTALSLNNVANESRATILGGNLTGTINSVAVATVTAGAAAGATANQDSTATIRSGTTAANVDLGNVTNESKATMFSSAALTGNPTAPTQAANNNSTRIATTAYVQTELTDLIGTAPAALDTLGELSASLASDQTGLASLTTTVGTKLAKASNLDDLANAETARDNLGLGTSAVEDASSFASSTQGTKADAALPKAGGIMTGALTLSGAPSSNLHAATKAYVDGAVIANTDTQDLSISGQTLSLTNGGSVTLPDADTQDLSISGQTLSLTNGGSVTLPTQTTVTGNAGTVTNGVYTTGDQTIGGNKTFTANIIAGPDNIYFTPNDDDVYTPYATNQWHSAAPFGDTWHDVQAFNRNYTTTQYVSTDGTNFSSETLELGLFAQQDKSTYTVIDNGERAVRWKFYGVAYNVARYFQIASTYSSPAPTCTVKIEISSDDSSWTEVHSSSGITFSASSRYYWVDPYIGNGGAQYVRVTIDKGDAGTKLVRLSSIKMLSQRLGDQGKGSEDAYPYTWDKNKNMTIGNDLTVTGGDITLSGTGRIQGIDTVTDSTDAASKAYVDGAVIANTDTQDLSISGQTLSLTNGGSVTLPDADSQNLSISGTTLSLENGGSVTIPQRSVSDSVSSTSTTTAASSAAVKTTYDLATQANSTANTGKTLGLAALPTTGGTMSGTLTMNSQQISSTGIITAGEFRLDTLGDAITFYGGGQLQHSIMARDASGTAADDLRINSYGAVYVNLDSNNNNTSTADFVIGNHGDATGTINTLFTLSGEDGDATFSGTVIANGTTLTGATDISGKLSTSGGTMTGALTLSGAPSSNLHAATKAYVDGAVIANTDTQDLSISGQTLSLTDGGSVTLPTQTTVTGAAGSAAKLTDGGGISTDPGTGNLIYTGPLGSSVTGLFAASDNSNSIITVNRHSGNYNSQLGFSSNGNVYYRKFSNSTAYTTQAWKTLAFTDSTEITNKLLKSGGTMTGALTLSGAPTSNLHAATKAYVDGAVIANTDTQDLSISGQTLSLTNGGSVTLPDADTQDLSISGQTLSLTNGGSVTLPTQTSVSGNAGSVTNGVYTTGDQSIAGVKSFSGKIGADGGIDGLTNANGGIAGSNYNISGVNQLTINDPGEGFVFTGTTTLYLDVIDDSADDKLRLRNATQLDLNSTAKITNLVDPTSNQDAATKAYVDGAVIANTDTQDLSISGQTLSLTNGGSVTLPDADTQDLSISGTTLSLTNGGSVTIPQRSVSDSVSSTSTTVAASSAAVKSAYDRGSTGITNAASAATTAEAALPEADVDADIKTLSLPANTTISAFGKTLIDDATASDAIATLGLGTAATTAATAYATAAQGTTADNALAASAASVFGKSLIDDADAAAARTTLGLGTAATSATGDFATGDNFDNDGTFASLRAQGTTKGDVGLGSVANESRATILGGNLTGTINSVAVATVTAGAALGATSNQDSTSTIRSGTTKSDVDLGNVANESRATILGGNLTGTINSVAVATVTAGAALGATSNQDSTSTIRSGTTAANVSLGNVTNESKATMFTDSTLTGKTKISRRNLDWSGNISAYNVSAAQGDVFYHTAAITLVTGQIYYMAGNGNLSLADADATNSSTQLLVVALGTNASTDGVLLRGFVSLASNPNASPGAPLYLSTTSGTAQSTAPSGTGDVVRILGYQLTTDGVSGTDGDNVVYFNPDNTYVEIA